jgi:hypothetical protein
MLQDNKSDMSAVLNQRSTASDPSLFGVPGAGLSKPSLLSPGLVIYLQLGTSYMCNL